MAGKLESRPAKNGKIKTVGTASPDIAVDFPREEELVIPGDYAIRVSASPDAQVEISLNGGDWAGCRNAVGYYWFDWKPSAPGEYTLEARQKVGKGRTKKSERRFFRVVGKKSA